MYKEKKILIFGMARSGYECAKLLAKENQIIITDQKDQDSVKLKELENQKAIFLKTDNPEEI